MVTNKKPSKFKQTASGAKNLFDTTHWAFVFPLGVLTAALVVLSWFQKVGWEYALVTVCAPVAIWFKALYDQKKKLKAKDDIIQSYKDKEAFACSDVMQVLRPVRDSAANGVYNLLGMYHQRGFPLDFAPTNVPGTTTYARLRSAMSAFHLWMDVWNGERSRYKERRKRGVSGGTLLSIEDVAAKAEEYVEKILDECDRVEEKARKGEV